MTKQKILEYPATNQNQNLLEIREEFHPLARKRSP